MDAAYAQASRSIPGLRRVALKEMGSDVMSTTAAPLELVVYGPNLAELHRLGEQVASVARGVPGLVQVSASSSDKQPELQVFVDRTRASQIGRTRFAATYGVGARILPQGRRRGNGARHGRAHESADSTVIHEIVSHSTSTGLASGALLLPRVCRFPPVVWCSA